VDYTPEAEGIPEDLFYPLIGYDDIKSMMQRALDTEARVHWLLAGPPASANLLMCLERLPSSGYTVVEPASRLGAFSL
jgi:hypothetical protein